MREYIYGEGSPYGNEKLYKEVYLKHSEDVLTYFKNRPKDFLHINDFSNESAQEIGRFLGYSLYDELTMPFENKQKY